MNRLGALWHVLPLLLLLPLTTSVRADDVPPPTRAARLTFLHGNVTVTQPGQAEAIPAQTNLPLLAGVLLTTADDGQAEVEFEDGSGVRLTPNTAMELESLTLEPNGVAESKLRLVHGVVFLELRATNLYQYTFSAGDDLLRPTENSTVRVDFDEPPPTFSVLAGSVRIEGPQGLQADVRAGENLRPDVDDPGQYHRNQGTLQDSWTQWNEDMDQAAASEAQNTTSVRNDYSGQQGYGWSDMDANGTWYDTSSGPVWQPYAADDPGFDPYANGSWVAYSSVGYVWASAYPWGWTPYRCGNWSYSGGFGWGWSPGASCGTIGWRFQAGGRPVNIARAPDSYRPIRVPSPGHGVQRPLLRVQPSNPVVAGVNSRNDRRGPRQIGGVTANPIQPVQNGWRTGSGAAALHRDFAVDGRTHQPVAGVESTRSVIVHTWPAQPSAPVSAARPAAPINPSRPADHPVYGVQYRPGRVEISPPVSGSSNTAAGDAGRDQRRNRAPAAPVQTYSPASAPANPQQPIYTPPPSVITGRPMRPMPTPAPATTQSYPRYTPPAAAPQPHPVYTPPPPQSHPVYTPPPAPPAQSHPMYTPPPSAPPSAPRASSPPPASGGESASGVRGGGRR